MKNTDHIHVFVRYDPEASYSISTGAWEAWVPGSSFNAWGATKDEALMHLEQSIGQIMKGAPTPELLVLELPTQLKH